MATNLDRAKKTWRDETESFSSLGPRPTQRVRSSAVALVALAVVSFARLASAECLGEPSVWDPDGPSMGRSIACLGCHDGTTGPAVPHTDGVGSERGGQHPVQISYVRALLQRRTPLAPVEMIDDRLVLPGGQVECVTCHDYAARDAARLAMPNDRSGMCLQCHKM